MTDRNPQLRLRNKGCLRFSVRSFLLAVAGLGMVLGIKVERARNQHQARLAIQQMGGAVIYDSIRDELRQRSGVRRRKIKPWAPYLPLSGTVKTVPQPRGVVRDLIGNDLFEHVVAVSLRNLNFAGDQLIHIKGFPYLEELYLNSSNVTDHDLLHLESLSRLKVLSLRFTEITDSSIRHLLKLRSLESLDLRATDVSPGGLEELKAALPACDIQYGPGQSGCVDA